MASGLGREEFKEIRVTASSWTFLDRTPQEHGADWPEDFLVTQRVPAKFWTKEEVHLARPNTKTTQNGPFIFGLFVSAALIARARFSIANC